MAKKKYQPPKKAAHPKKKAARPKKKAAKRSVRPRPRSGGGLRPFDPRTMEGLMRSFLGDLAGGPAPETPLDRARALADLALEEPDPKQSAKLAAQALEISPDCADAYIVLAEMAPNRKEALELYQQAVAAAERALGPEVFRDDVGHFWGLIETRPYMRARERLAHTLWTLGRREEAADHLRDMLRLNPNDNQGLRYILSSWLLNFDRDDELAGLIERYDEDAAATWAYARVLLAFRRGDEAGARKLLQQARKVNKHVPAYLTGERPLPADRPDWYSLGGKEEAILYAADHLSAWKSTPGAVTWLRGTLSGPKKKGALKKAAPPVGPSALARERLRRLPQRFDVWQADCRPLASLVEVEGAMVQPWMALATSRTSGLILAQSMSIEPPSPPMLWDLLSRAMAEPSMEKPHRPTRLEVRPDPSWAELRPAVEEIGVEWAEVDELEQIDFLLDDLAKHLTRDEPPGLLDMPGMTPERVGGFYRAAAEFYRRAPWKTLGYEEAIEIRCDRFESGPWYAVIMGQSGLTLGVALYEDLNLLRKLWAGTLSDEQNARQTVALTVTFDPETQVPTADLLATRERGWEVASPEAYPTPFRKERGMTMRAPLAWELELLEGVLRALPEFVVQHRPGDTTEHAVTVPTTSGTLDLVLKWVDEG
jgi:tetratricopeptide (TPR) repeat protein